jgi:hypothetical protein
VARREARRAEERPKQRRREGAILSPPERRLGELIKAQKETVGLAQGKRTDLVPNKNQVEKPTLAEAGIDKKLSSRAQKLAAVATNRVETLRRFAASDWETLEVCKFADLLGGRCAGRFAKFAATVAR